MLRHEQRDFRHTRPLPPTCAVDIRSEAFRTDVCNPHFSKTSTRAPVGHWRCVRLRVRSPANRGFTARDSLRRVDQRWAGVLFRTPPSSTKPLTLLSFLRWLHVGFRLRSSARRHRDRFHHHRVNEDDFYRSERLPSKRCLPQAFTWSRLCHRWSDALGVFRPPLARWASSLPLPLLAA
jgi:hypothetical protein